MCWKKETVADIQDLARTKWDNIFGMSGTYAIVAISNIFVGCDV